MSNTVESGSADFLSQSTVTSLIYTVEENSSFAIICLSNISYSVYDQTNLNCPSAVTYSPVTLNVPFGASIRGCVQSVNYIKQNVDINSTNGSSGMATCLQNVSLSTLTISVTSESVFDFILLNIGIPNSFDQAEYGMWP